MSLPVLRSQKKKELLLYAFVISREGGSFSLQSLRHLAALRAAHVGVLSGLAPALNLDRERGFRDPPSKRVKMTHLSVNDHLEGILSDFEGKTDVLGF